MTLQSSLISSLPAGVERAILRVLSFHQGAENAIPRFNLLADIKWHGFDISEREMRAAINSLRKGGALICSAGGLSGGYYSPASPQELEDYFSRELHPRAMDLLEQERAMKEAAEKLWGKYSPARQMNFG